MSDTHILQRFLFCSVLFCCFHHRVKNLQAETTDRHQPCRRAHRVGPPQPGAPPLSKNPHQTTTLQTPHREAPKMTTRRTIIHPRLLRQPARLLSAPPEDPLPRPLLGQEHQQQHHHHQLHRHRHQKLRRKGVDDLRRMPRPNPAKSPVSNRVSKRISIPKPNPKPQRPPSSQRMSRSRRVSTPM